MTRTLIHLVCLFCSHSAMASDWRASTFTSDNSIYYIDIDTIKLYKEFSKDITSVWFRTDDSKNVKGRFRSTKQQVEFKCDDREMRLAYLATYDASGKAIETDDGTVGAWKKVVPDSLGEDLYRAACKGAYAPTRSL